MSDERTVQMPLWEGAITGGLKTIIPSERLITLETQVCQAAVNFASTQAGKLDPTFVRAIRNGLEDLVGGHAKDESHSQAGTNWAYWTFLFSRNAFRITALMNHHKPRLPSQGYQVLQLGGGPAEDLVGIVEYAAQSQQIPQRIRYLSVDNSPWDQHLDQVRGILALLYPSYTVDIHELRRDISAMEPSQVIEQLDSDVPVLVIVANLLVVERKAPGVHSKLTHGISRLCKALSASRPRSADHLAIIEPPTYRDRVTEALCLSRNDLAPTLSELRFQHCPMETGFHKLLGLRAKRLSYKAVCWYGSLAAG